MKLSLTLKALLIGFILFSEPSIAKSETLDTHDNTETRFSNDSEVHQLFLTGIDQAFRWQFEASRKTFNDILKRDPESPAGYYFLGALTLNTIQYMDPERTKESELFALECFETAIIKADKILEKDPHNFRAVFFKGAAHGFRGIQRLQKAQFLKSAADARIAKVYMDFSLKLNPKFYDAYSGTGMYNYFMDALPAIIKFLKFILLVPPGDKELGIDHLHLAAKDGTYGSTYAKVVLASIYRNFENDFEKALKLELEIAKDYPEHPWYALERGSLYVLSMKDFNRGEKLYKELLQKAMEGSPTFQGEIEFYIRYRLAKTKYLNLKPLEAISDLKEILKSEPKEPSEAFPAIHLLLGEIYHALGNKEKKIDHLKKVKSFPDSRNYRHERMDNRIIIPNQASLHQIAEKFLSKKINVNNSNAYRLSTNAWRLLRERKLAEAERMFQEALQVKNGHPLSLFGLGETFAQADKKEEALVLLRKLTRLEQTNPSWISFEASFRSGLLYDLLEERDKAIPYYKKAAKMKNGNFFHKSKAKIAIDSGLTRENFKWPNF